MFIAIVVGGCHQPFTPVCTDAELAHLIETRCPGEDCGGACAAVAVGESPDENPTQYRDLSLEEALQIAFAHSQVLRDLGGTPIHAPDLARTVFDPAIQHTDPQFGVQAALSAFDANFAVRALGEKNKQRLNNQVFGDRGYLREDQFEFGAEVSKRSVTGGLFALRQRDVYLADNTPTNQFPSAWDAILEGEFRQPLLQGAGVAFNRLAGPGAAPGTVNGVVIARIRSSVSVAEFALGVRDMLSDIENAYWDLYYAYRDLETKKIARDLSLITWNRVKPRADQGSEAEANVAQAKEQYFRFEQEVLNALYGRQLEGTRNFNGSSGGTFRANPGVRVAERRLRFVLGLPESDGCLLRPTDEPSLSKVVFDWPAVAREALVRRAELRRQRQQVRRRELELVAERSHLLPTLDVVGRYRFHGFGQDLFGARGGPDEFDPAFDDPFRYQEWQLGLELSAPLGFRRAHAAVRNAELRLARERAILEEQQREIIDHLAGALIDVRRAYEDYQVAWNRCQAARQQVEAFQALFHEDKVQLEFYLEAQRRLADSQSQLYQVEVEYMLALKNVQFEKGSLLDYCGVRLSEDCGGSPLGYPCVIASDGDKSAWISYVSERLKRLGPGTEAAVRRSAPAAPR